MQDRPTHVELLDAVRAFLAADLAPAVTDRGLRFRVLIAANLLDVVTAELGAADGHFEAEVERLGALMPDVVDDQVLERSTAAGRRQILEVYERALVERIRAGSGDPSEDPALWAHVRQTLVEKLSVVNPRFDTGDVP